MGGPTLTLNTGAHMPLVGFGTFLSKKGEVAAAVTEALKTGYRHIDCAATYENEEEIGEVFGKVFKEGEIKREDVFITSKLWITEFHPDKARAALLKTLKDLQLDYLDLYLIHIPVASEKTDGNIKAARRTGFSVHDTWKVLEKCYEEGLVKAIGVSNYPAVLLNDLNNCCKVVPAVNQIERHPYLSQLKNVAFNKELGLAVTAYAPLGAPGLMAKMFAEKGSLMENEIVKKVAEKHGKAAAQVLIRWSVDSGVVVIPKSVTASRIQANFDVFDFKLDGDDMAEIAKLDCNLRSFTQDWMGVPCFL